MIVLQTWNGRGHAQNCDPTITETSNLQALKPADLLKASLCVSARNPLGAVTDLLKPVSGGCTGQWSCCDMPAPLKKQTNKQKTLIKLTKNSKIFTKVYPPDTICKLSESFAHMDIPIGSQGEPQG